MQHATIAETNFSKTSKRCYVGIPRLLARGLGARHSQIFMNVETKFQLLYQEHYTTNIVGDLGKQQNINYLNIKLATRED